MEVEMKAATLPFRSSSGWENRMYQLHLVKTYYKQCQRGLCMFKKQKISMAWHNSRWEARLLLGLRVVMVWGI